MEIQIPIEIVFSRNKETWNDYDFTTVTLASAGDKVYFRAKTENDVSFFKSDSNYYRFVTTDGKRVAASGNMQTLMKANGSKLDISDKTNCYSYIFFNCTSLTQAPALPATTLADSCYSYMFNVVGQPLAFSDKTTNDIADYIADEHLIGDYTWYSPDTSELISPVVIICTDGQLSATFDESTYTWTIQIESL